MCIRDRTPTDAPTATIIAAVMMARRFLRSFSWRFLRRFNTSFRHSSYSGDVYKRQNLELTESEENLQIKADYALDMNEEHVADCYLAIQVQPRDCKDFVL